MSGAGPQSNPNYVDFMHGDIFQGFGFMVDPEAGYKSVTDFIDEGMEPTASIKATAGQFRGKALATLNEGGIRGFITIALESAGMSMDDIKVNSFDTDSKIVAEMISGRTDLGRLRAGDDVTPHLAVRGGHAGLQGAPGRVPRRLGDHAGLLREQQGDALSLASMIYRTLRLMVDRPQETIPTHTDFLNSIMGSTLTPVDVEVILRRAQPLRALRGSGDVV